MRTNANLRSVVMKMRSVSSRYVEVVAKVIHLEVVLAGRITNAYPFLSSRCQRDRPCDLAAVTSVAVIESHSFRDPLANKKQRFIII
jgi:hypothetical protein